MNLILATSNPHKVSEIRALCEQSAINAQVYAYSDIIAPFEIAENGSSFAENASIKLLAIANKLLENPSATIWQEILQENCVLMAEDSGLCVEALNNEPHIFSARYADSKNYPKSAQSPDKRNISAVISELGKKNLKDSRAHFIASIALLCFSAQNFSQNINLKSQILHFEERLEGKIIDTPRGEFGFGYDSIFIPQRRVCEAFGVDSHLTLAQIPQNLKNRFSHRAKALQSVFAYLKKENL